MIDLNYGENYRDEIALKHEVERRIAETLALNQNHVLLNYGSNSSLMILFSAFSVRCLNEKRRRLKLLLDYRNSYERGNANQTVS
ncbi:MAG TPA: hypothetical protein DD381_00460 [Lentisphaeria bacterium]|nr:MAG: hypothetical protein A2X47_05075 [Lentisphaerae bacterium GWF2_38_69]HBM14814.1 hypothetical protein [Lentisphaeria bacterium]